MKALLLLPPLIAVTVMSCSHDELTSLPGAQSQSLAAPSAVSSYEAFDIAPPGVRFTSLGVLTKHGVVFGFSELPGANRAFRWEDGALTDRGELPLGATRMAVSEGGLVGGAFPACDPGEACEQHRAYFLWNDGAIVREIPLPAPARAGMRFLHDDGTFLALLNDFPFYFDGTTFQPIAGLGPPGSFVQVIARNDKNQMVGSSDAPGYRYQRAFIWEDGITTALPDLGTTACSDNPQQICSFSFAEALNNHGDVVGAASANIESGSERGVLWRRGGQPIELGALPGEFSTGRKINDHGEVVVAGLGRAFLWDDGTLTEIGNLGVDRSTVVRDLNERGEVVGFSRHPDGQRHGYVWRAGQIIDLGTGPDGISSEALQINDKGEIAGGFLSSDFQRSHVIVWRPVGNTPALTP